VKVKSAERTIHGVHKLYKNIITSELFIVLGIFITDAD
jgi:sorbitol-specific phosphotransferase system component IIC